MRIAGSRNYILAMTMGVLFFLAESCGDHKTDKFPAKEIKKELPHADLFKSQVEEYERADRVIWQKPDLIRQVMGDISEKTIADIGAGSGFFAFRLLPYAGSILALEIDPQAIAYMDSIASSLPETLQSRFSTRQVSANHSGLKQGEADVVLLVNTYTYIRDRIAYFKTLQNLLPDDAMLIIIDYKKKELPIGPEVPYKLEPSEVITELNKAGFRVLLSDDKSLDYQYIIKAVKG